MDPLSQLVPAPNSSAAAGEFTCKAGRAWCTWNGLHGGALMGMLINGMEQMTGKPAVAAEEGRRHLTAWLESMPNVPAQ